MLRVEKRPAPRRYPAEPRFGDRRRAVCGLRRRARCNVTFKYAAEKTPARNYTAAKITVKGLKGGHSGIQIGCQRANANKVLFRFLNAASASCDVLLCSVDGGGLRNAIPREAEAVVMVKTKEYEAFAKELKAYEKVVRAEYAGIEDAVSVKIRECEAPGGDGCPRGG